MPNHRVLSQPFQDLSPERFSPGRQRRILQNGTRCFPDLPQRFCRKEIGRNQIPVPAGIIAGPETAPRHTGPGYGRPFSRFRQRIGRRTPAPFKIIGRLLHVPLFRLPDMQDRFSRVPERFIAPVRIPCFLPEAICQTDGIAQGIHLIFVLPDPGLLIPAPAGPVRIPMSAVSLPVESIRIRIQNDILKLPLQQSPDNLRYFGPVFGIRQIMVYLSGGIPQPHGRNISGDQKYGAFRPLKGRIPGAAEALPVHMSQLLPALAAQHFVNRRCRLCHPIHSAFPFLVYYFTEKRISLPVHQPSAEKIIRQSTGKVSLLQVSNPAAVYLTAAKTDIF